jgi:hypothetical protein
MKKMKKVLFLMAVIASVVLTSCTHATGDVKKCASDSTTTHVDTVKLKKDSSVVKVDTFKIDTAKAKNFSTVAPVKKK